jgi:hypothetical protein
MKLLNELVFAEDRATVSGRSPTVVLYALTSWQNERGPGITRYLGPLPIALEASADVPLCTHQRADPVNVRCARSVLRLLREIGISSVPQLVVVAGRCSAYLVRILGASSTVVTCRRQGRTVLSVLSGQPDRSVAESHLFASHRWSTTDAAAGLVPRGRVLSPSGSTRR